MKNTRSGISLNLKFFLMCALIIVALIGATLLSSSRRATELAHQTIRSELKETLSVFETFQKDRYEKLKISNKLFSENSYIQAYIAESDSASILDLARQTEEALKCDFIIVTDPDGIILARTDKPAAHGQEVGNAPLIAAALEGEEATGLWLESQKLFHAIALPVIRGDELIAALVVSYAISDTLANQIKGLTHSETAFFVSDSSNQFTPLATTISGDREDLMKSFSSQSNPEEPFQFQLGQEKYIGVFRPLKNADGKSLGAFAAFRSLDRELFAFRQFTKNILIVGIGIMVFAFLISFLGARRITGPLRNLTNAINEVKEGNYNTPIEVTSRDEVGVLAESFKRLLSELKEKEQLVEYLSQQPTIVGSYSSTAETAQLSGLTEQGSKPKFHTQTLDTLGPGSVIANRYEVQSVLGTGGMGLVLKAHDRQLDEVVALKLLKGQVFTQDPAALERFKQEIKLARRITHRNVVRTYDYSEMDRYYVISMEYVKGVTLKHLLRARGSLPVKIGLQIGKQICSALDAAHEKGVIHRDMKPQNVLLESTGDVKIMDFGIARVMDMKGMTSTGTVMGTPDYMSPEQAQGLAIDHRTDIYSTGIVLYEVFCGKLPFIAESPLAVLNKHIREVPTRPTLINSSVPVMLEQVLLKTLSKNPDQRYQHISQLYSDLDAVSASLDRPVERIA